VASASLPNHQKRKDAMGLFGNDYDRDYGYRRNWGTGYDNTYRMGNRTGYDRNWGTWGTYANDRDNGYMGGDRDYGYMGGGYDRDYKSRWQTDYGDPFGDRGANTPMRMIRGEYRSDYDRNFRPTGYDRNFGYNASAGYDRDYYEANPMGYDPYPTRNYMGREGTWGRGYDRNNPGRGYDNGWF
jgi:hypothetical protein